MAPTIRKIEYSEDDYPSKRMKHSTSNARSSDGYEPGAIRRIILENFVTYHHVEYTIGPSLNMIIGPNGTGKSTIVCAICLGLGGKPDILGRARSPAEFIKNGYESATITLELQNTGSDASVVKISRTITKNGSSSWRIGNRPSTQKEIQKIVNTFNIQIDNLCQFLPQDRVASFAKIHPTELLIETERAVGSLGMVEKHKKLIELDEVRTVDVDTLKHEEERLEQMNKLQEEDREILERMEEHKKNQNRLKVLDALIPSLKHRKTRQVRAFAKMEYDKLLQRKQELYEQKEQLKKQQLIYEDKASELDESYRSLNIEKKSLSQHNGQTLREIDTLNDEIKTTQAEMKELFMKRERRKDHIKQVEDRIAELEGVLENQPEPDKNRYIELGERIALKKDEKRNIEARVQQLRRNKEAVEEPLHMKRSELRKREQQMSDLQSVEAYRLHYLENNRGREFKVVAAAIKWLRKNKDMFKEPIYEPPVMCLEFKDPKMTHIISAAIDKNSMLAFTACNREDYDLLAHELIDKQHINVAIREYSRTNIPTLDKQPMSMSRNELKSYGFEGYVIDLLDGPAPVLNMLCHSSKINQIPYSAQILTTNQLNRINATLKPSGEPMFFKYMDRKNLMANIRSRYGRRLMSCKTDTLAKAAPYIITTGASEQDIEAAQGEIRELIKEIQKIESNSSSIEEKINEVSQEITEIQHYISQYEEERKEYQQKSSIILKLKNKIADFRLQLEDLRAQEDDSAAFDKLEKRLNQLCRQLKKLYTMATDSLNVWLEVARKARTVYIEKTTALGAAQWLKIQTERGTEEITERIYAQECKLETLGVEIATLKELVQEKTNGMPNELKNEIKSLHSDPSDLEDPAFPAYINDRITQFENELNQLKYLISSAQDHGGEAAQKRYEEREVEIQALTLEIESIRRRNENYEGEIAQIRETWEPELERMVETISTEFSKAFEFIKCKGKVRLGNRDLPFKDWCIEILVSFRQDSELQVLTHQRQSGGERAVSTIFYLISLQTITKSPFRVVDEINQGMDPRNERIVHHHMVQVACAENSSQYFLITPKLLQDLEYHPRMKIHMIFSGSKVEDVSNYEEPPSHSATLLRNMIANGVGAGTG